MQLNSEERAALVKELAEAMTPIIRMVVDDYNTDPKHSEVMYLAVTEELATACLPIIDRLLATPEPTADAIERAAKAMFFTEANTKVAVMSRVEAEHDWGKHLAFYQSEGYDPEGFFPVFDLARAGDDDIATYQIHPDGALERLWSRGPVAMNTPVAIASRDSALQQCKEAWEASPHT